MERQLANLEHLIASSSLPLSQRRWQAHKLITAKLVTWHGAYHHHQKLKIRKVETCAQICVDFFSSFPLCKPQCYYTSSPIRTRCSAYSWVKLILDYFTFASHLLSPSCELVIIRKVLYKRWRLKNGNRKSDLMNQFVNIDPSELQLWWRVRGWMVTIMMHDHAVRVVLD